MTILRLHHFLDYKVVEMHKLVAQEPSSKYAIQIENKSFTWGLQWMDVIQHFTKVEQELKGIKPTVEAKSPEQILEDLANQKKREDELNRQRKMSNILALKDINLKIRKG